MKPVAYFDFKEINENEVMISKKRLKEILTEVYEAGVVDGRNQKDSFPLYYTTTSNPSAPSLSSTTSVSS